MAGSVFASVEPYPEIGVGAAYGNGWRQLWKYFLVLFIIGFIVFLIGTGTGVLNGMADTGKQIARSGDLAMVPGIALTAWGSLLSFAYGVFLVNPVNYGVKFAYLKAARNDRVDVTDMFEGFRNYWNAVAATILVGFIVILGFILLIVPGIVFACKLAFTPYLVVDRKMGALEAIQESWRMTTGHAFKVFLIALLSVPIFIGGVMCFIVGVIVSIMWTKLAFASLYHAVSTEDAALGSAY